MSVLLLILLVLLYLLTGVPSAYAKGGSTRTVDATGPKSENLLNLENQFYDLSDQLMNPYLGNGQYDANTEMGRLMTDAQAKQYTANSRYDSLMSDAKNYTDQINNSLGQSKTAGDWYFDQAQGNYTNASDYLAQAGTAGDPWYDAAWNTYGQANDLLGQMSSNLEYGSKANQWYDDYTRDVLGGAKTMLDTGEISQPLMDAMLAAMTEGVNQTVGSNLSNMASRGVVNSSVANKGMSDLSRAVSDSMNENYLNAFNTLLGGYNQTAGTAANAGKTFADTYLNFNNDYNNAMQNAIGLGDSYGQTGSQRVSDLLGVAQGYTNNAGSLMDAGSQRINDWLNIAGGYGDALAGNVAERGALMEDIPAYWSNAMAPVMPSYDLLKTMQQDHWNSDKKDTIVSQGK